MTPASAQSLPASPLATANAAIGKYRWTICALVFFATTINYLDRAVISLLKPYLETEFHWNSGDYANIEIAFKLAYAVGMVGPAASSTSWARSWATPSPRSCGAWRPWATRW